jgi:hypothetical protein
MDFFINKGATLNILKMELIQDGRNDYKAFHEQIQNSNVYFSMVDVDTGLIKVAKRPAGCELKLDTPLDMTEEYYVTYTFRTKDTNRAGTYRGQFTIEFLGGLNDMEVIGTLIVPIRDTLTIHVLDADIKNR